MVESCTHEKTSSQLFGKIASARLAGNSYRQRLVAMDEIRVGPLRLIDDLDRLEALQDFLPHDPQLQFGEAQTEAAVNPEAEGDVVARVVPLDDEIIGVLEHVFVAVAREVPHNAFLALLDRFTGDLGVGQRRAAPMRERRLAAD